MKRLLPDSGYTCSECSLCDYHACCGTDHLPMWLVRTDLDGYSYTICNDCKVKEGQADG